MFLSAWPNLACRCYRMYMSLWMDDVSIGELPPIMLLFFTDCTMAAPL